MNCSSVTFEQVASALELKAALGQTISYNDFADEVDLPRPNNLFSNSALKSYFEQIDRDDTEEQRPFRTALVVQKTSGHPGAGFFKSLELHRGESIPESNYADVWKKELADLFDYYKPGQPIHMVEVELSRAQYERLMRLCEEANRTPELLIQGGITDLLGRLEETFAMIRRADKQIARGEVYTSEEVFANIEQRFRRNP